MFYTRAEQTRTLLELVGRAACDQSDFDAVQGVQELASAYVQAVELIDVAALEHINGALTGWQQRLRHPQLVRH
ncbi:hypothetical protein [Deinococcus ruber]|nr:hypothetical protein [Deinococcus ruber]